MAGIAIAPAVILGLGPRGLRVEVAQAFGDAACLAVLLMPDGPQRLEQALVLKAGLALERFGEVFGPVSQLGDEGWDGRIERLPAAAEGPAPGDSFQAEGLAFVGHVFIEEFKSEAFGRLKRHFGLTPPKGQTSLTEVLCKARGDKREEEFAQIRAPDPCPVNANEDQLVGAFWGMFANLMEKRPEEGTLRVQVEERREDYEVTCSLPCSTPEENDRADVHFHTAMKTAKRVFAENEWHLESHHTRDEIRYALKIPRDS